jgi:2-polyprenyl-3-methyl-5-hydroxy-6-metoxy-1,4-benzoquinol methylase
MKNNILENINCNFCGSENFKEHVILENKTKLDLKSWKIVRCENCGLLYTNPRLSLDEISKLYSSEYNTSGEKKIIEKLVHFLKKWRVRFARKIKGEKGNLILDVGCGDGYFLVNCKRKGYRVLGVDLDKNLSKMIWDKYGINILVGEFASLDIKGETVDRVTMHHMLEHSYDPMGDMKKAHDVLKKGGELEIEVPNVDGIEFKLFKKSFHYTLPYHTYHFGKDSLIGFLKANEFEVIDIKYPFFSPYIYSNSIIQAIFKKIDPRLEIILMLMMFPFILPFSFVSSLFGKGSIIFIRARK